MVIRAADGQRYSGTGAVGGRVLLTFVIIAATTVRKHRPDAAPIWAVVRLALPAEA